MLDKEFQYYIDNQVELAKKYNGKFLVIKNQSVIGAYDTSAEAYVETTKSEELGTFIIQFCSPDESSYTQTFHSRVSFS